MTAGTSPRKRAWRAAPLPVVVRRLAKRETTCAIVSPQLSDIRRQWSVEESAHRLIRVLVADRLGDQPRDREHLELVELSVLGDPDRVHDRDFLDRRRAEPLHRGTRQ